MPNTASISGDVAAHQHSAKRILELSQQLDYLLTQLGGEIEATTALWAGPSASVYTDGMHAEIQNARSALVEVQSNVSAT